MDLRQNGGGGQGAPGILKALAGRAREMPEEPWLFHRPGWTWRWRSYGQVADQVARGAEVLDREPEVAPSLAFHARQHPDALAIALAILASGRVPVASSETGGLLPDGVDGWAGVTEPGVREPGVREPGVTEPGVESGPQSYSMPHCRSGLEVWTPTPLKLGPRPTEALASVHKGRMEILPWAELRAITGRLKEALDEVDLEASGGRAILATGPSLDPFHLHAVLHWCLGSSAAWVLEDHGEAFGATVKWARPTVVVASGEELERLAKEVGERRTRRHLRLRAVVGLGGEAVTLKTRKHWEALEVPLIDLGQRRPESY